MAHSVSVAARWYIVLAALAIPAPAYAQALMRFAAKPGPARS